MSVTTTKNRKDYTGDGVSITFAYDFRVLAAADFQVYVDGVLKTLTTDYSVTGVDNSAGGNVVFVVAPANGAKIALIRVVASTQPVSYPVGNKFPSATHEKALDRLTMIVQQIAETFGRALKLKTSSTQKDKDIDDLVALKTLRVRADASGLEMVDFPVGTVAFPITTVQGGLGADVSVAAEQGDLLVRGAGLTFARLAKGADGHELLADATSLSWSIGRIPEHGRLTFGSSTQIQFLPFKGTKLPVLTSGVWRLRDIGAGLNSANPTTASNFVNGVANTALAANTTYLVCVFDNAGTLTFDFISGASAGVPGTHAADATTGVEIKTQGGTDNTRTVVGMVRTNGTSNFQNDNTLLGVRSWFNRPPLAATKHFTTTRSTTSVTFVEIHTEIEITIIVFADDLVQLAFHTSGTNSAGNTNYTGIADTLVSTTAALAGFVTNKPIAYSGDSASLAGFTTLSEGVHTLSLIGAVSAGTGSWFGQAGDTGVVQSSSLLVGIK